MSKKVNYFNLNPQIPPNIIEEHKGNMDKLLVFRKRYLKSDYCNKIAFNVLYIRLGLLDLLQSLPYYEYRESFNGSLYDAHMKIFQLFTICSSRIIPNIESAYENGGKIGRYTIEHLKKHAEQGTNGNNKSVEELEYNYIWHSTERSLLLLGFAYWLKGNSMGDSMYQVSQITLFKDPDFESLEIYDEYTNLMVDQYLQKLYTPLENYW